MPAQQATADSFVAGMVRRSWQDSTRPAWTGSGSRPLTTIVWYPAGPAERRDTLRIGAPGAPLFTAGVVAPNAPFAAPGRHPLILFSHGTGGSALQLAWLGTALARRGYVVAAVNHHGNTGAEAAYDPRGFLLWWERARDLSAVLDRILGDSALASHIDQRRVGAAGFSLGGYTVLALAGGIIDLEAFDRFCASSAHDATCEPQQEMPGALDAFARLRETDTLAQRSLAHAQDSYRDPRIGAIVAIAPALVQALGAQSLGGVRVPLLVVMGDSDRVAPGATNGAVAVQRVAGGRLRWVPGAGHYTFLSECTALGAESLGPLCRDTPGLQRGAVHDRAADAIAEFFDRALTPAH